MLLFPIEKYNPIGFKNVLNSSLKCQKYLRQITEFWTGPAKRKHFKFRNKIIYLGSIYGHI